VYVVNGGLPSGSVDPTESIQTSEIRACEKKKTIDQEAQNLHVQQEAPLNLAQTSKPKIYKKGHTFYYIKKILSDVEKTERSPKQAWIQKPSTMDILYHI
jgi:hypothetical protein